MDRRQWIWIVVAGLVLMAAGFYFSSLFNLSNKVSSGGFERPGAQVVLSSSFSAASPSAAGSGRTTEED